MALSGGSALSKEGPSGFQVVVHPENPTGSVGRDFLEQAFLKRKTRWPDDETVRPVDQRADSAVRERFSEVVLRRSVAAVKRYWQQQIFTGRGVPPPELDTDRAVVEYVRRHRGAVGYVAESADVGAVKTISFR